MIKQELSVARGKFLADMLNYYTTDPSRRAISYDAAGFATVCDYRQAGTGKMCAIGRHIILEKYTNTIEGKVICDSIMNLLPQEIQELGLDFLMNIQTLHDGKHYWNEVGLTNRGSEFVKNIKSRFNLTMPTELIPETVGDPPTYIEDWIEANLDLVTV